MDNRCVWRASVLAFFSFTVVGCASTTAERQRVEAIAQRRMNCSSGRFSIDLHDEAVGKRTWTVQCDFRAIRVSCTEGRCSDEVERLRMFCEWPPELWSSAP